MSETTTSIQYPAIQRLKWLFSSLSNYYFVPIAILSVVAFFSPPVASLGVVVLLTGAVWVLVDACGGVSHSLDFLFNQSKQDRNDPEYTDKKIHLFNVMWCMAMFVIAISILVTPVGMLWASLASIAFGCAMWIYVLEDLHAKKWDVHAIINPGSFSRLSGGLGALFFALYASGMVPYAVGVFGMVCYAVAAMVKLVEIVYKSRIWPTETIANEAQPSNGTEFAPIPQKDPDKQFDIEVAPQARNTDVAHHDSEMRFYALSKAPQFSDGFIRLMEWATGHQLGSDKIEKAGEALVCRAQDSEHDLVTMMACAATEYNLEPIYIAGGDAPAQMIAIQAALRFGFTDIEVRSLDHEATSNSDYEEMVAMVQSLRENYRGHASLLESVQIAAEGQVPHEIFLSQYNCLPEKHRSILERVYAGDAGHEHAAKRSHIQY